MPEVQPIEIQRYTTPDNKVPFEEWFNFLRDGKAKARIKLRLDRVQHELHLKKLDELLSEQGSDAIYSLGTWLKALGLKLTVAVCTETEDNDVNAEMPAQLTV